MGGIVELAIVFMLGVAVGYVWRDRLSRIRRARDREQWRAKKNAVKYGADAVEAGYEKWHEGPQATPPAGSVARPDGDSALREAGDH